MIIVFIIEIIKAVLIGIIQGITEWLPISSTGHMILADEFIKLDVSAAFMEMFLVVVQLGSILAVCVLYFKRLNPFAPQKTAEEKRASWLLWLKVAIACVPAAVIGILFDDTINELFYNHNTVVNMLLLYGAAFIIVENLNKNRKPTIDSVDKITYKAALAVGAFQVLSLIPGTSRSGATIIGAIVIGLTRVAAAEFSFILAIPVMFGASALKMLKFGFAFTGYELTILIVGMLTAFVVSFAAIRFLLDFVKKNTFRAFGYYRIILGTIVLAYFTFRQ